MMDFIEKITDIMEYYLKQPETTGVAEACRNVAIQLSMIGNRKFPWTYNYVHQVWRQKLKPSKCFHNAVFALHEKLISNSVTTFEEVSVLAPTGTLPNGILVSGTPRPCKHCGRLFLPTHWNHSYCSNECRMLKRQ